MSHKSNIGHDKDRIVIWDSFEVVPVWSQKRPLSVYQEQKQVPHRTVKGIGKVGHALKRARINVAGLIVCLVILAAGCAISGEVRCTGPQDHAVTGETSEVKLDLLGLQIRAEGGSCH